MILDSYGVICYFGSMNEIERRIQLVEQGRRDPLLDYSRACEELKHAHESFKNSKGRDRKATPSPSAQENYARALREVDICSRVLDLTNALKETA